MVLRGSNLICKHPLPHPYHALNKEKNVMPLAMTSQQHKPDRQRYFDPALQTWTLKVSAGCWDLAEHGEHLVATTASAVSLLLWDKANNRAALAHFMVEPHAPAAWTNDDLPSPHADALLEEMWHALRELPSDDKAPDFHAYVVGGGSILLSGSLVVGQANVMKAVDWLHQRHIPIEHYDVGQPVLRKVSFNPTNGEITVRRIIATSNDTIRQREEDYLDSLQPQPTKEYDQ